MTTARDVARWGAAHPRPSGDLASDTVAFEAWHAGARGLLEELAGTDAPAAAARASWRKLVRCAHAPFIRCHMERVVDLLRLGGFERALAELGRSFPWLVATPSECEQESARQLPDKLGYEYKTAVLLAEVLADPQAGEILIEQARRPSPSALRHAAAFEAHGLVELGAARVRREGAVAVVEMSSPHALNAEDEQLLAALEACVDLALLDERVSLGLLRGAPVQNQKYAGRRVFCSGINLSALYEGRISYLYYVRRELGMVNKLYRGLALPGGETDAEKPWCAVVDTHAIGGGCQLLLVMDYVVAERTARLSLPANAEGILPGVASLRLPRFMGECTARRLLLSGLAADSEEGRLLVDQAVPAENLSWATQGAIEALLAGGRTSLLANRRAARAVREPPQSFRQFMSYFALAQADCYFDAGLVRNLERNWLRRRHGAHDARASREHCTSG